MSQPWNPRGIVIAIVRQTTIDVIEGPMSLTKRLMELDEELPAVSAEAFSDPDICEVDDDWMRRSGSEEQAAAMEHWFRARYCDPALETPYSSDAGGYMFTRGGPFHPHDVLMERFEDIADFDTIEELARELIQEVGYEWAPTSLTAIEDWEDIFVDTARGPLDRLRVQLDGLQAVLRMDGPPQSKLILQRLVFAAVITALETFLWELAAYWLENDPSVLDRLIERYPDYGIRLSNLGGDTHENRGKLRLQLHEELKGRVWHRWEKVWPFLSNMLDLDLPPYEPFELPVRIRHDIVHRGGQDKEHNQVVVRVEDVDDIMISVLRFAESTQIDIDAKGLG
jgi:hypothetical protein